MSGFVREDFALDDNDLRRLNDAVQRHMTDTNDKGDCEHLFPGIEVRFIFAFGTRSIEFTIGGPPIAVPE